MLDIGWSELLVVGILALLVVGPRELPRLMRTVGSWARQARGLAREFQRTMDDVAREADLKELADARAMMDDVRSVAREARTSAVNPGGWAKSAVKDAVSDSAEGDAQAASGASPAAARPDPPKAEVAAPGETGSREPASAARDA